MTIRLSQLRVTSEHDSTRFVAGNKAVEQSSAAAGAAVSRLSHTIELQNGKVSQGGDVLARLSRQYVAGYRDAERFASSVNQLNQGLETGKIDMQEADRLLAGMHRRFGLTANGAELAAQGYHRLSQAVDGYNARLEAGATEAAAQRIHSLRVQYDEAYASASRLDAELRYLAELERAGIQITGGYAAALDKLVLKHDAAAAAAQKQTQEYIRLAQAERMAATSADGQALWNTYAGLRDVQPGMARESAAVFLAADKEAEALAGRVAQLRAQLDPAAAAQDRLNAEIAEYNDLAARHLITTQELAAATALAQQRSTGMAGALGQASDAANLNTAQMANMSYQINDIAVMLASGQNPFVMLMQQGMQISQIFGPGVGVAAAMKAVGGAIVSFVTNPLTLAVAGIASAAGAASFLWRGVNVDSKTAEQTMERHVALVKELERGYGLAADKIKAMSFETSAMMSFRSARSEAELRLLYQSEQRRLVAPSARGQGGFGLMPDYDARTDTTRWSVTGEFQPFTEAIDMLRRSAEAGVPAVREFRQMVAERWALEPNNEELAETAKYLLDNTEEALKLADAFNEARRAREAFLRNVDAAGRLRAGEWAQEDMARLRAYESEQRQAMRRARRQFDANVLGLGARSPAEMEAAARAREAATYNNDESAALRRRRIDLAGTMARLSAEHQLAEAQKERTRAYDATLAAQRIDLDLIGKTGIEAEALRLEFELLQQVREEAARNNVQVDEAEIARIREMTAEYRRVAQMRASIQLRDDLAFDLRQMGRTPREQRVASQLRSAGLAEDLNSAEAAAIRFNERLKETVSVWEEIRGVGMDAIDKLVDSAGNGFKDIDDVAKSLAGDILKEFTTLAAKNPVKNAIYGTDLPTMQGIGGVGGFLSALFGGPNPASGSGRSSAVGAMTVTATSVFINGMPIGGALGGNLSRLLAPANGNTDMSAYRQAIASIESLGSGGYSAIGPTHAVLGRALGKYQIMEGNIGPWSQAALGRSIPATEFMANPSLQDAIFDHRFGGYLSKYGPQGAASMWFTGRPDAPNVSDAFGTSGPAYVEKFNDALDRAARSVGQIGGASDQASQGVQNAAQGLSTFGSGVADLGENIRRFMASGTQGGGAFGLLNSLFGGGSGFLPSFNFMNSISPRATSFILGGGVGLFAKGGISDRPAIFGEAGPEAAVPLPDGRRIPVELRQQSQKETAPVPMLLMGQIGVTVDDDLKIQVAIREMGVQAMQAGAAMANKRGAKGLPNVQGSYQLFGAAS